MSFPAEPQSISPWPAPRVTAPLDADIRIPGSKSLTNRYLVLAALADGPSRLRAPLHSRDTELMVRSLRALGATVTEVDGDGAFGPDLEVRPMEPGAAAEAEIDCGLAGTVMRFVPPLAALKKGSTAFDGDPHARIRPMSAAIDALRGLGVDVHDDGAGSLPFTVSGTGEVAGGRLEIDAGASSQFVSALLLAGARFRDGLHLVHSGVAVPSRDHIAMTVQALRGVGVVVDDSVPNEWKVSPGPIRAFDITIEPDLSNAGPFLAAALVAGGTVRMAGWPEHTSQVGDRWRQILPQLGGTAALSGGTLTVTGTGHITGAELADTSELAPTVAALCALADSPSRLTGIAHLRGHETDRLAALATEINRLGGDVQETEDGLSIRPAALHGGLFETYADHRMATAGALIGLAVPGVLVQDIDTTAKTLPEFPQLWQQLTATVTEGTR
ncbi:3-phosphoshikimate 1-carboxyvinyltransferase [Arthrobacter jiangjiafuii]|uniref:3-phosphoshikimate 1-carboxyvinyltransferase n=1 Tax=Arthrobacter jiangjiafuii TaxID=2817475 RepID=A0A975M3R8_9MICC|nr:3-phosphoshikimate 1-carboxyvinyltransferase [Arthrobacter jiangjiafuii]MBP3044653.1 3-phosphoshikimate 1-carboxyvinyltransferase [Arthrobacter jiangjiafuii]QWC09254.1 3-phosphoshikimate 1-carboxyvinyltransferase [Arthrobacter jiangjiafuii]